MSAKDIDRASPKHVTGPMESVVSRCDSRDETLLHHHNMTPWDKQDVIAGSLCLMGWNTELIRIGIC